MKELSFLTQLDLDTKLFKERQLSFFLGIITVRSYFYFSLIISRNYKPKKASNIYTFGIQKNSVLPKRVKKPN